MYFEKIIKKFGLEKLIMPVLKPVLYDTKRSCLSFGSNRKYASLGRLKLVHFYVSCTCFRNRYLKYLNKQDPTAMKNMNIAANIK